MKPDDLIGVGWLTIEYCEKVTLPVNKLGLMKQVVIINTNDIEFDYTSSENNYGSENEMNKDQCHFEILTQNQIMEEMNVKMKEANSVMMNIEPTK